MIRNVVRWGILICTLLLLAACEQAAPPLVPTAPPTDAPTSAPTPRPTREPEILPTPFFGHDITASRTTATLRLIHAAPDLAPLDITLEGAPLMSGLGFGLIGGLTTTIPGSYHLIAYERGTTTVVAETQLTLFSGVTTDVVVIPTADGATFLALNGPEHAVDAGTAMVRVLNSAGINDVAIEFSEQASETLLAAGAATDLLPMNAGDLNVRFSAGGTDLLANKVRMGAHTNLLLILTGIPSRLQLLVVEAPTLSVYALRVINMSPDVREIDVLFDDAIVAANLPYQAITERVMYSTAPATLSVYAAGADVTISTPYLDGQYLTPKPGTTVTLAIYGTVDDLRATWIEEDVSQVPAGRSRVSFVHTLPGIPALRLGLNSTDMEDIRQFGYGEVSQPVLFAENAERIFFRDASRDGAVVELQEAIQFPPGQSILYFVIGQPTGEPLPPVMFGQPVEVDETFVPGLIETPAGVFNVRYVNAIASQPPIDILQDGIGVAANLPYGAASNQSVVTLDSAQITARVAGTPTLLLDIRLPFSTSGDYTVFIYGTPENGINALLLPDGRMSVGASMGTMRLINLSQEQYVQYGAALVPINMSVPTPTPAPTLEPTATTPGAEVEVFLSRIPSGLNVPARNVDIRTASRINAVPPNSLVYIINMRDEILAELPLVAFAPGTHTDIVVYEYRTPTDTILVTLPVVYQSQ